MLSRVYWRRAFLAIFCPELPPGTRQARDLLLRDPAMLTADERDALHLPLFAALSAHYEVASTRS